MTYFNILLIVFLALTMEQVRMVSINQSIANEPSDDKPQDSTKQVNIAVVGDSQTVGLCPGNTLVDGEYPLNWPTQLQAKLDFLQDKKYNVSNFAVSATTVITPLGDHDINIKNAVSNGLQDWIKKKSYTATVSYQKVKESKPDIVLMMVGVNGHWIGWPRKFKKDYVEFIKSLQDIESKPELFIMIPTQFDKVEDWQLDRFHNTSALQQSIAKKAGLAQNHIIRVDQLLKMLKDEDKVDPQFGCDGIHFTQKGSDTIANAVVEKLQEAKRIPSGKDFSQVSAKTCKQEFENQPQKIEECKKRPHGWLNLDPFP